MKRVAGFGETPISDFFGSLFAENHFLPSFRSLAIFSVALIAFFTHLICPTTANADGLRAKDHESTLDSGDDEPPPPHGSIASKILLYIPNRIFDFLDIFRIRARVGPGFGASVRVTKYVATYLGAYATIYGGLPGPRMRKMPRSPIGFETYNGATLSVLDGTWDGGFGPDYSPSEIGVGIQLAVVGIDIGIDPVEIADFFAGILMFDIRDDDFE